MLPYPQIDPVAIALGLVGALATVASYGTLALPNVGMVMFDGATKFPLIAIPLFILAGAIMNASSISRLAWSTSLMSPEDMSVLSAVASSGFSSPSSSPPASFSSEVTNSYSVVSLTMSCATTPSSVWVPSTMSCSRPRPALAI